MYETTYVQAKANGFKNCPEILRKKLDYLTEVSNTMGHDMSALNLSLVDAIDPSDKRALNKVLFSMSSASVPVDRLSKFREVTSSLAEFDKAIATSMQLKLKDELHYALTQANEFHRVMSGKLELATITQDKLNEVLGLKYSIATEIEKVLKAGFWTFQGFDKSLGTLKFVTTNEVVMSGSGAYSSTKLNMGYYQVVLAIRSGSLRLYKFKGNRVYSDYYYHPYCSSSGDICFGNSTDAANKMRTNREYGKWFELLASLLCYYDQNSNPYVHFSEFVKIPQQVDTASSMQVGPATTESVWVDESRCSICGRPTDYCNCHYCEACDVHYADGSSCGGHYCDRCGECYGENQCEEHWCSICGEYTWGDDGCTNGCCTSCDSTDRRCNRCRSCGLHNGEHEPECSDAPAPEPDTEPTF